jgi:hypothetical protein
MTGPAIGSVLYFMFSMTVKTKSHFPRVITLSRSINISSCQPYSFHSFNRAMTGLAFNFCQHVAFMREVNKIG